MTRTQTKKLNNAIIESIALRMASGMHTEAELAEPIRNLDVRYGDEGTGSLTRHAVVTVTAKHVAAARGILADKKDPGELAHIGANMMSWAQ
jgi:hypothetical protein